MRYRSVLFDVDGTLIDSSAAIEQGMSDVALKVLGRDLTAAEREAAKGLPAPQALEAAGMPGTEANVRLWLDAIIGRFGSIRLFDGVAEMLRGLRAQGVVLAIVTADTRYEYEHVFSRFGLDSLFEAVVCSDDTLRHKPDPEPLELCLSRLGTHAPEALYVGDGLGDARAAAAAGVDFALAAWKPRPLTGPVASVATCASPADLLQVIRA